ncbi:MAG TPA: helix-turn-helix domain-containing protein, partial [Thermoanaerobaculia bacterium]|nr:helix-turn-helix domain-containing protein [Thermoanaerobaculia bacterium]
FYRLNIIPIVLPPLRERKVDIESLAEHFVRKICRDLGVDPRQLEPGIIDLFQEYSWPGNVRELESTLHRAIVMATGEVLTRADFYGLLKDAVPTMQEPSIEILPRDLLSSMIRRMPISGDVYEEITSRVDRQLIEQALAESGGKIRETARRLGLARNTLKAKLLKYNITAVDPGRS